MALKKLTLSIEETVIERAKDYSDRHGTSISRLVSEYLAALADQETDRALSPRVRRLLGILPEDATRDEYRRHLEDKYLR